MKEARNLVSGEKVDQEYLAPICQDPQRGMNSCEAWKGKRGLPTKCLWAKQTA